MNLPKLKDIDVSNKKVLVRLDLDVDSKENIRLTSSKETLEYLISKGAKVIIIGHRGRPEGKVDNKYSLLEVSNYLGEIIGKKIKFVYDIAGAEAKTEADKLESGEVMMLENLRFDKREEENNEEFAKSLAALADVYIDEAFGVSHRKHASIVGVANFISQKAIGFRFEKELENLNKIIEGPERPLTIVVSGIKKDKLDMIDPLSKLADKTLVGGRLPDFLGDEALVSVRLRAENEKVIIGNLVMDKEDITLNTIERFEKEILKSKTVVLAGVLGKYEDQGHRQGTERVFKTVANCMAFKVAGGGDTIAAIEQLKLSDKFDWISVGGGAMMEYLINKTLPGIEALQS